MVIFNILRQVQHRLLYLSGILNGLYLITKDVIILKTYLAPSFNNLSDALQYMAQAVDDGAEAWYLFYKNIEKIAQGNGIIDDLAYYADMLISIAKDPGWFIRSGIREFFPGLGAFIDAPGQYILNVLRSAAGWDDAFILDPRGVILGVVNAALGVGGNLLNDPTGFVTSLIDERFPLIGTVLNNPYEFVRATILEQFPTLGEFLNDPRAYIINSIIYSLDEVTEKHADKIADFIGEIINRKF